MPRAGWHVRPRFEVNDTILARYKGRRKWYPGKVTGVAQGGYDLWYVDGETEISVNALLIQIDATYGLAEDV